MQRTAIILACFFIPMAIGSVNCFSQQYPFVHYTPKDGLISNQIRSIYQDSRGRLYFTSINGLSVYDGARFINYTSKNGLANDIVNCVMEMGDDSVWIVTNIGTIHCLVHGKLKPITLNEPFSIIDILTRDDNGNIYAASEEGLFLLQQNKFVKLPFFDIYGRDVNTYISYIIPFGNYLLVQRNYHLFNNNEEKFIMYLYSPETKTIIAQSQKEKIYAANKAPDGRIWVSTEKHILSVDTTELKKGKIVLQELPDNYAKIKKNAFHFIFFDQQGNCWLIDKLFALKKVGTDGSIISFTTSSGLSTPDVSHVFQDKEGTIWISTNSAGVDKLVHSNFSFTTDPFGLSAVSDISYAADKNQLLFYSLSKEKAIAVRENNRIQNFEVSNSNQFNQLIETPKGLYGISENAIYKMIASSDRLYPTAVFVDTIFNQSTGPVTDRNGNLILSGNHYLTVLIDGKTIYRKKINYFADKAALDTNGNVWIATRDNELVIFETKPGDPANYLEQKNNFRKELSGVNPRSLTIDRNNTIWIGSRSDGLYAFKLENGILTRHFHLTAASGLSENFVNYLAADTDNNIWACTPSGLDRISIKNGVPVIENLTKQNNIYQSVSKVVIDKNKTAWASLSSGLIKITSENRIATGYVPKLMIESIKTGKDTIEKKTGTSLSYKQNNLSFYFSAPTYLDEKQVRYSYQLQGSSNTEWTEPSNNAMVSFIDLHAGDYTLNIKASFPAGRYPEQNIQYRFFILPPWWQTWWFRIGIGISGIGILIASVRFYYRRKLEKQKAILEKQQAIEKVRTRIATDMHDDLGAGLTRIKFITENLEEMTNDVALQFEMKKLKSSSNDLVEKMTEIIWAMSEKNNSLEDLIFYLRSYAVDYCNENRLLCEFIIPENIPQKIISGQTRRNVFLILKESLHNIVKHADAKKVIIDMKTVNNLSLSITDDGKGFENMHHSGHGLSNMQLRAKALNGKLSVSNTIGTTIQLEIPV